MIFFLETWYSIVIKRVWKDDIFLEKKEVKIGAHYVCHGSKFSWFFVGEAVSKKEEDVQVRVVKCHPSDRLVINCDEPILNLDYFDVIEDA